MLGEDIVFQKAMAESIKYFGSFYSKHKDGKNYAKFIEEYLSNYYKKYSQAKTFLHSGKQLNFKDFYYPLKIRREHSSKKIIKNAKDLFHLKAPNYITITGDAGGGKSTFVKNMFMEVICAKKFTPLLIELRTLEKYDSLNTFIFEQIIPDPTIRELVAQQFIKGSFVFFLDGYDELKNESKVQMLARFVDQYPNNKFILTSRPSAGAKYIDRFENYFLSTLDEKDVPKFATKQLKHMDDGKEIENGLILSLKNGLNNANIKTFLSNPLLLSIYILTYKSSPNIPDKKTLFYRRVFDALYFQHDAASKVGYKRNQESNLNQDDLERILKKFSYMTYLKSSYTWEKQELHERIEESKRQVNLKFESHDFIKDMTVSIALWVDDEGKHSFAHRSFQEYFTCYYIKENKEKKKIYEGLLQKYFDGNSRVEIGNLLSLLEEVDEESFVEYFKLPLFKKTRKILNKDSEQFIRKHAKLVYFTGSPQQVKKEYASLVKTLKQNLGGTEINNDSFILFVMGFGIGMDMGITIGVGSNMNSIVQLMGRMKILRQIEMVADVEMMAGIGAEAGMVMDLKMGMRMGIRIGMELDIEMDKELEGEIAKRIKGMVEDRMGWEYTDEDRVNQLQNTISQWLATNARDNRAIKSKKDNSKNEKKRSVQHERLFWIIGFASIGTADIGYLLNLPYIKGEQIINLFESLTWNIKEQPVRSFVENQKKQLINFNDIPDEVITGWTETVDSEYNKYKQFIEGEINVLEEKTAQFNSSNEHDLSML